MLASAIRFSLEDELVYSIFARYADFGPRTSLRNIGEEFFGTASVSVSTDLPRNLDRLAKALPPDLGCTAEYLIAKHTLFSLYAPFLSAEQRANTVKAMRGNGHPHFASGLAASGILAARSLCLCQQCMLEDISSFGCAVWHCSPQAPGVYVCHRHAQPLLRSVVRPYRIHANPSLELVPTIGGKKEEISNNDFPLFHSIAMDSFWLLSKNKSLPGPERLHGLYYEIFRERGYLRADGSVRVKDLSDDLREYFGHGFLKRLSTDFDPNQRGNWVERLARRPRNTQAPLRHLLLIQYLGLTAKAAMARAMESIPVGPRSPSKPHRFRVLQLNILTQRRSVKRHQWTALLNTPYNGSLRAQHDNLYSWLWRNDHTWLLAHRPVRRKQSILRIDWSHWDMILTKRLERASRELKEQRQPFIRLSWNRLASASGKASWLVRPNRRLPSACRTISMLSETAVQFAIRRIASVTKSDLLGNNQPWRLRVTAGISVALAKRPIVREAILAKSKQLSNTRKIRPK